MPRRAKAAPPPAAAAAKARKPPFIIAIDGPAGAGKGTLAKALSARYRLPYLDTGLTYRFVAAAMLARRLPLDDAAAAAQCAKKLDLSQMESESLRADFIGSAASQISALPALRAVLAAKQRQFAQNGAGAVLDGRDIGTVICPQAQLKLFVTADLTARAQRRLQEMRARGIKADYETILADMRARDTRDESRSAAPLRPAADAHLLDTTKLSIEEAFKAACALADAARAKAL